jgi:hypothetical protein
MGAAGPLELLEPEVVRGLIERFRLSWLLDHFPERLVWAYHVRERFVTIGLLSLVAMVTPPVPFVFPLSAPPPFLLLFFAGYSRRPALDTACPVMRSECVRYAVPFLNGLDAPLHWRSGSTVAGSRGCVVAREHRRAHDFASRSVPRQRVRRR